MVRNSKWQAELERRERDILELIARGASLPVTLVAITALVEGQSPDMLASILLLDEHQRLHMGAAPSVPAAFNDAIEGTPIGPQEGSCGTAAYLRRTVVTADIATDPLWKDYAQLALDNGLAASWSTPLFGNDGEVLGTLAQYYRPPRDPSPIDEHVVEVARRLAEIAIGKAKVDAELAGARQALLARAEVAEQLDRLKGTFIHTISHELRTPLTTVIGYLELLQESLAGPLTTEQASAVNEALSGTHRLESLVADLLDYARIEGGVLPMAYMEADVTAIAREMLRAQEPQARQKGVSLALEAPDSPILAVVDVARIAQVLANFMSNAIRFAPDASTVTVRLWQDDDHVGLEVADLGPGVPVADRTKLFRLFSQLDGGKQRGGTGLGLAIAKGIVDAHGGQIGARDPASGPGVVFYAELPRHPAA